MVPVAAALGSPTALHHQTELPTALVHLSGPPGRRVPARALIDACSEVTVISATLARLVGARLETIEASISGVGGESAVRSRVRAHLRLELPGPAPPVTLTALCLLRLGLVYPSTPLHPEAIRQWADCEGLADSSFGTPQRVDLLIGADYYHLLLRPGYTQRGEIVGQLTVFGWVLAGRAVGLAPGTSAVCAAAQSDVAPPWHNELTALLQWFWEMEDLPQAHRRSDEDIECERAFADHRRATDGRYIVRLPLKGSGSLLLGDSLQSAKASLAALQRWLRRSPDMAVEYSRFMADYLAMGHMRPLTSAELAATAGPVNYIHHHGIWQHADRGRKLRVVFNASNPTSSGHSLNDVLHAGPRLPAALPSVIMRWRRHRIAFCSDIRMMFRQIWIDYRDVNLQRIVWAADPSQPPTHYQLLTVTYGESCSPYLSLRTLQQLCQDEGHNWPEAVSAALCDRYADDFLSGADDVTAARRLRDQLSGLMKAGGFPLRKWVANVRELLDDLPDDVRLRPTWEQLSAEGLVSELGVKWDPPSDCFQLTPPPLQPQSTKRTMLAALAGLFDPCGWLAPIVLNAKLLLQDLWRARLGWDEPAPISMTRRWAEFTAELQAISTFTLPRWIGVGPSSELHLHGFSDASRRAMAAVIYSRLAPGAGPALCHILLARTKLSPIRSLKPAPETSARMTIPRLELRTALIAAKLLRTAADELRVPVDRCHAWCDSQIVLHWLRSDRPTNNVLIDNYVAQIQEMLPSSVWRYVPTQSNPADLATRGADMTGLRSQRTWWEGPAWLAEDVDSWPLDPLPAPNQHSSICCVVQQLDASYLEQFSNLRMLLSFLVRIRRFVWSRLGRGPMLSVASPLTPTELHDAFLACVRLSQEKSFSDDLQCLRRGERLRNTNPLVPLAAFLDDDGILRVGGLLEHSPLTYEDWHPPILSGASSLASMVIVWAHSRALHGGYRVTSASVCKRA
ncbi:uncharacterized protein LOC111643879 [Copidosoma floridanum]|uniref:uncharacterized protein LOC111643879 n=1 Tax=Copidosoma floridanum TaxID=29053 RepID=UPI000C6FB21D|nr:uncharacterized protein LOC111643879 [Copidosoma floridanum]